MEGNFKFNSEVHQQQYLKNGFLTCPLLNLEQIAELEQVFHRFVSVSAVPEVYATFATTAQEVINVVNEKIIEICSSTLDKIIKNFRIEGSIFFIKKSGEKSNLGLHIDPSMTLEGFNNVGLWIPLCDIDEQTGRICLLPNSHRFLRPYSASTMPCPYYEIEDLVEPHLTCLSMKAGEALFFDNNMLHSTQKNSSGKTRIAAVFKLLDENAPLVTTYYNETAPEGEKVSIYQHAQNVTSLDVFSSQIPPINSRFLRFIPELPKIFTKEEFSLLLEQKY